MEQGVASSGRGAAQRLVEPVQEPYWEGCRRGQLWLQQCTACGAHRHPASDVCSVCLSPDASWVQASGRATVYSYTIVHQALDRTWKGPVPYCVAIVALEEGPHMLTNIVDAAPEDIAIGLPVQVVFDRSEESEAAPRFRPATHG